MTKILEISSNEKLSLERGRIRDLFHSPALEATPPSSWNDSFWGIGLWNRRLEYGIPLLNLLPTFELMVRY